MNEALTQDSSFPIPSQVLETVGSWHLLAGMVRSSRAVHSGSTVAAYWQSGILFCRQFAHRETLRGWYGAGRSPLQQTFAWRPELATVVRRPYISTGWQVRRRLRSIEEHYRLLTGRRRGLRLERGASVALASVTSRSAAVQVVLDSPPWFIHEGELSVNLFHEGKRIYTLAFSLGIDAGEPVAYAGAIQGLGSEDALALYRSLTHALHGMRPRDLLIAAFRVLCGELGLARWLAVGDQTRVAGSPYFGASKKVRTSYDEVWQEHGGRRRADGFFCMPVEIPRRTHEAIPARKRSLYRQRYEMLDRLAAELGHSLGARDRA
ncbi:MAG: VirK/YbjX family protein [Pseudomonadota bacterium]|nr:VirK/YbjX family protein [Pseudomonadota bacterium]